MMTEFPSQLGIGELENRVLNAIWDMEQNPEQKIYVSGVMAKIESSRKKWAYTTIKTVLDRMVEKDVLIRNRESKKFCYQSSIRRDSARELALTKVLQQYFQNDTDRLKSSILLLEQNK